MIGPFYWVPHGVYKYENHRITITSLPFGLLCFLHVFKMVICTCSYCRAKQVIVNGVSQPGCNVSAFTRLKHEKRAKRGSQGAVKPQSQSPSKPPHVEKSTGLLQVLELQYSRIDPHIELTLDTSSIVNLCCTLVIWLNLKAGVS